MTTNSTTAPTVTVVLNYDVTARQWNASCESLPGVVMSGITLRKARHRLLRRLRATVPNLRHDEAITLPEPEASAYAAFNKNRETQAQLEREVPKQRLELAQRLIRLQMSVADAARVLQISPQRLEPHLYPPVGTSPDAS